MERVFRIARKEFQGFFSSPVAFIFLGAFLAVNLFIFFWVEAFFATNIAEVRPLFTWMPLLLLFLTSAVTMRMWAEERRAGTLELLMTAPVRPLALVMGKFLGCLALVVLALLLTLPLPITVSLMGPLDWGPVWGGYVAAVFLAAAYIAIGLYVSVNSENQIVSLIVSTLVCSLFYLLGSDLIAGFFGTRAGEILQLLGTGSRFESITRGVIDFRDLYYYLAIMGIFLSLNVYGLEKRRWAGNPDNRAHRAWKGLTALLVANFLLANFWLAPIGVLRADLTQGNIYSISEATRSYLGQLKEPLLIRGYFSAKTHPLLAPLVPRLRDLLAEYSVAGGDRVNVEFVDPLEHPELEQEAGRKYGIRPVPFQTTSKYQASVTNSYFDILVQYGDQYETLGFGDLVEVKVRGERDVEVELRNPEYDITRAIRKTLYSYQGEGNLFADIGRPVAFRGFISDPAELPDALGDARAELIGLLEEMKARGQENFSFSLVDPDSGDGALAERLQQEYGFRPMAAGLFDPETFWFYMVLQSGDQVVEVPLPQEFDRESLRRSLQAGLKRFSSGFTKTIALHTEPVTPPMPQYNMPARGKHFSLLKEVLQREHAVVETDLKSGQVPAEADLLILASPEKLDDKQLFAVDQFLMRGGTVVVATASFDFEIQRQLSLVEHQSRLEEWLASHGIAVEKEVVLDARNSSFPLPVERDLGGFVVQETKMVDYPFFADIRRDGMNEDSAVLSGLSRITMHWASPLTIDEELNGERTVTPLLHSSPQSWTSTSTDIQPDFDQYPQHGFPRREGEGEQLLGVLVEGEFTSFFQGKPSPLLQQDEEEPEQPAREPGAAAKGDEEQDKPVVSRLIEKSPESARIFCFSSNAFLADTILDLSSSVNRTGYLEPVQMIGNVVDYSLEDSALVSIRGRSHFSRPLYPLDRDGRMFFEYLNYALALVGLLLVWGARVILGRKAAARERALLEEISATRSA